MLTRTCSLNSSVQSEQVGLTRNFLNNHDAFSDGLHRINRLGHSFAAVARIFGRLGCHLFSDARVFSGLFDVRSHLLNSSRSFFGRRCLFCCALRELFGGRGHLGRAVIHVAHRMGHFTDDITQLYNHVVDCGLQITDLVTALNVNCVAKITFGNATSHCRSHTKATRDTQNDEERGNSTHQHRCGNDDNQIATTGNKARLVCSDAGFEAAVNEFMQLLEHVLQIFCFVAQSAVEHGVRWIALTRKFICYDTLSGRQRFSIGLFEII